MPLNRELVDPFKYCDPSKKPLKPMRFRSLGTKQNQNDFLTVYNFMKSVSVGPNYRPDGWTYKEIYDQIYEDVYGNDYSIYDTAIELATFGFLDMLEFKNQDGLISGVVMDYTRFNFNKKCILKLEHR